MTQLIFATCAANEPTLLQAQMLAHSLRAFGGAYRNSRFIVAVPDEVSTTLRIPADFQRLHVEFLPFSLDPAVMKFPFGTKVVASAAVERHLSHEADTTLVWMDSDCLVLQQPDALLLPEGKTLGYRPVDHTVIGSRASHSVDFFWQLIYNVFRIDADWLPTMTTTVDQEAIRPYFNAGLVVVHPADAVLRRWSKTFLALYHDARFKPFYTANSLYAVFMHQAVLTGVILSRTQPEARHAYDYLVHYPLHMHREHPQAVSRLNDLITCRYDTLLETDNPQDIIHIDPPLTELIETFIPNE